MLSQKDLLSSSLKGSFPKPRAKRIFERRTGLGSPNHAPALKGPFIRTDVGIDPIADGTLSENRHSPVQHAFRESIVQE